MVNFRHIQLHPDDRVNFTPEVVLRLLNEQTVIGIGEGWENDGGQPDHFRNWMQIGDIVAVRDGGTPIALVEITGPCEQNEKQTEVCWFDLIRRIRILSTNPPPTDVPKNFLNLFVMILKSLQNNLMKETAVVILSFMPKKYWMKLILKRKACARNVNDD